MVQWGDEPSTILAGLSRRSNAFGGRTDRLNWELATELIVVKIRWFGILMGVLLVESRGGPASPLGGPGVSGAGGDSMRLSTRFIIGSGRSSSDAGRCSSR